MNPTPAVNRLAIEGEFSIFTAAGLRERLLEACAADGDLEIDLARVSEIDSAGVQLMLAACREAAVRGKRLRFRGDNAVVAEIIGLLELTDRLGYPPADRPAR